MMQRTHESYIFTAKTFNTRSVIRFNWLPHHQTPHSALLSPHERPIQTLNIQERRVLQVAIQIYRGILKQRWLANYNTGIYLCIYLDFLYTCQDVGCCGLCYLRPVWQGLASTGRAMVCWLFIPGTHNDAAVSVPKASLFPQLPPFLS